MPQTLLEIDYDTVIDDEDVIDEFCTFKETLEGDTCSHITNVSCMAIQRGHLEGFSRHFDY